MATLTTDQLLAQGRTLLDKGNLMLAQTQSEGNKSFATSSYQKTYDAIKQKTPILSTPKAPTKATDVTVLNGIKMPTLKPTYGDPAGAFAENSAVGNIMKEKMDLANAQNERDTKMAGEKQSFIQQLMGGPSRQDVRSKLEKQAGIQESDRKIQSMITESESLAKDYAATVQKRDEHVARLEENNLGALDQGVDMRVMQAEKFYASQLNRKSADINAKAAVIQALQGNVNSARNYINQAVDDFVADRKDKVDAFMMFQEINQDLFDKVDKRYADAYDTALKFAVNDYETARQEKLAIGEMMLKYNANGAGITLNDSLEDAYRKASSVAGGTGGVDQTARARAMQVISGMATLDQFTPTEAANVRDAMYMIAQEPASSGYTSSLEQQNRQSLLPSYVQSQWQSDVMTAAQKGQTSSFTSPINDSKLRALYSAGATNTDIATINSLLQQGMSYEMIKSQYGMPDAIYKALTTE